MGLSQSIGLLKLFLFNSGEVLTSLSHSPGGGGITGHLRFPFLLPNAYKTEDEDLK